MNIAEKTEAIYQGSAMDDDIPDGKPRAKDRGGSSNDPQPTHGLSIGDYTHRQFVAELYADTGTPA